MKSNFNQLLCLNWAFLRHIRTRLSPIGLGFSDMFRCGMGRGGGCESTSCIFAVSGLIAVLDRHDVSSNMKKIHTVNDVIILRPLSFVQNTQKFN